MGGGEVIENLIKNKHKASVFVIEDSLRFNVD